MRLDIQDLVGRTLAGRYRVVRPIGQGGMGAVFEAVQLGLERPVALKVLFEDDPRSLARFRQEATATAKLRSPNVVAITEFVEVPDAPPFLVMELLDGEPLGRLLAREKKLTPERAVGIARQVLAGLAQAHAIGIVHRDIKPSNIFLVRSPSGEDVVKILDFGIAKLLDGGMKTTTGALLGTPAYLAPEQVLMRPVGPPADVHAVGIVLHELLTGVRPWANNDLMASIAYQPAKLAEGIAPWLADVVACALAKDPAARYPDAAAMLAALKEPRTRTAHVRPAQGPQRPVALFVVAFAVTAAVAATGIVLAARARRVEAPVTVDAEPPSPPVAIAPTASEATSAAPAVEDAAPPPPPSATATAAPKPRVLDGDCVCAYGSTNNMKRPLCQGVQTPKCNCWVGTFGQQLCKTPHEASPTADGRCMGGYDSFGAPGKKNGDACEGYKLTGHSSVLTQGQLNCNHCWHVEGIAGVHGAPCTGIWQDGEVRSGTWDCGVRRR